MESTEVLLLLDQLDDEIDELEDSLAPVFKASLSIISSTLPVLDKAKLFTLVTYTVESILFSYLKLNGVNAREHAVFKELTRVKQYFDKIKAAESPTEKPSIGLNKEAAKRFIKASLRGNYKTVSNQVSSQVSKTTRSHVRFREDSEQYFDEGQKGPPQNIGTSDESNESNESDSDPALQEDDLSKSMALSKKRKAESMIESGQISPLSRAPDLETTRDRKRQSRKKKIKSNGNIK